MQYPLEKEKLQPDHEIRALSVHHPSCKKTNYAYAVTTTNNHDKKKPEQALHKTPCQNTKYAAKIGCYERNQ